MRGALRLQQHCSCTLGWRKIFSRQGLSLVSHRFTGSLMLHPFLLATVPLVDSGAPEKGRKAAFAPHSVHSAYLVITYLETLRTSGPSTQWFPRHRHLAPKHHNAILQSVRCLGSTPWTKAGLRNRWHHPLLLCPEGGARMVSACLAQ